MTPRTLFGIASSTNAFTATLVGMLVDDGMLQWDDPLVTHLPELRLADPFITQHATLRDALAHLTGVGRAGDMLWYDTALSRDTILVRMRHAELPQTFRQGFAYSNIMYLAVGQAAGRPAGSSWDELIPLPPFDPQSGEPFHPLPVCKSNSPTMS